MNALTFGPALATFGCEDGVPFWLVARPRPWTCRCWNTEEVVLTVPLTPSSSEVVTDHRSSCVSPFCLCFRFLWVCAAGFLVAPNSCFH